MSKSAAKDPESSKNRWGVVALSVAVLLLVIVTIVALDQSANKPAPQVVNRAREAALASLHSPSLGDPGAKVHIVEFLDPACETCALFYPMVKDWLSQAPGQLRLSVRHVAFHTGADHAVRILEASRKQNKYWETLERMLASQREWVQNHTVMPERILPALGNLGLDMDRLLGDMQDPEVARRMEQDRKDSIVLKVAATPEYFVNGRPLPSFGQQQLLTLVREELAK
jgi:protein-disulfide isomerase